MEGLHSSKREHNNPFFFINTAKYCTPHSIFAYHFPLKEGNEVSLQTYWLSLFVPFMLWEKVYMYTDSSYKFCRQEGLFTSVAVTFSTSICVCMRVCMLQRETQRASGAAEFRKL